MSAERRARIPVEPTSPSARYKRMKIIEPKGARFMKRPSSYCSIGTVAAGIAILMLAAVAAIAPEAFAWGRGVYGGGFGGEGFGGGGFNQGEGYGGGSSSAGARQMYIYPSRGQSPQQEQNDRGQCYTWAVQQSGFNPANPQIPGGPPPAVGAPQGGLVPRCRWWSGYGSHRGRHRRKRWRRSSDWRCHGGAVRGHEAT